MSDDAKKKTTPERMREISQRVNDIYNLMRSQRDMLRQRKIRLPDGAFDDLRKLKRQVDVMARTTLDNQAELRSLRALARTTALINSSQDSDEVLNEVMDTVIALTGAERGYIVLRNRETGEMEFRVARGIDQDAQVMIISRTIVNQVTETGEAVLTDNASEDSRYQGQDSIVGFALRSILAVPLKARGEVIGVVYCDNRFMASLFKDSERDLLTAFANQAAVAIENARLFENARLRLQQVNEIRERMDNLFTSIASGIITLDDENRVLISNTAAEQILQRTDLSGQWLQELMPTMPAYFYNAIQQARTAGVQEILEVQAELLPGNVHYLNAIISPLRDATTGEVQGVAIVIDDVTEQKTGESQIEAVRNYLPLALVNNISSFEALNEGGQEREITALFADVRGFTSFSENLQPEELMLVINRYLSLASDAINLFSGIVDKYMGDAVTGLFNTQLNPQSDHPIRAVNAAMQLVLDLYGQHDIMPEEQRLFYGIGIHTGMAYLGNVGGKNRKEFSAIGEATDICKYLQEQAGPGEVIVSEATYQLINDTFECERKTEIARPKEGFEDVVFYRVLRRRKGATTGSLFLDDDELEELRKLNEL